MREIKFRAWDEEAKLMIYSDNQLYGYTWEINEHHGAMCIGFDYADDDYGGKVIYRDKLSLMQYIGLKDKNGKEIYEGDIVFNDLENVVKKVYFDKNYARFGIENEEDFCMDYLQDWEVIGNIYENPNLLGDK